MLQSHYKQVNFFDESNDQDQFIPSHVGQTEDSNPLFPQGTAPASSNPNITKQQTKKREQNALKVSISVMHKILFWQQGCTTEVFHKLLKEANSNKNFSTPVKFIILARKADLLSVLKKQFSQQAPQHINELKNLKHWSQKRLIATMEFYKKVKKAIHCSSTKNSMACMWENHNHPIRNLNSYNDIMKFSTKMKRIKKIQLKRKS